MARHQKLPELKLKSWKVEGKRYSIDPKALEYIVASSSLSDAELRAKLGYAYEHLETLLKGGTVDIWAANIIEYAVMNQERPEDIPYHHGSDRKD